MQIAGTTSQTATTAATTTPVQPLGSPTSTVSQAGNVVMVMMEKFCFYVHVFICRIIIEFTYICIYTVMSEFCLPFAYY